MTDKNSASVWMPLYIGDYLADTARLTTAQHGAYLLLIMDYWMNGPLPNDDETLAQISRMSPDAWSIASSTIRAYFEPHRGRLHHKRIDAEKEQAIVKASKRTEKAHGAALARWSRDRGVKDAPSNAPSTDAPSNAPSNARGNAPAMLGICQSQSQSQSPGKPPYPRTNKGIGIQGGDSQTGENSDPFARGATA